MSDDVNCKCPECTCDCTVCTVTRYLCIATGMTRDELEAFRMTCPDPKTAMDALQRKAEERGNVLVFHQGPTSIQYVKREKGAPS